MKKELLIALFWVFIAFILSFVFGFSGYLLTSQTDLAFPVLFINGLTYAAISIGIFLAFKLARVNVNEMTSKQIFVVILTGALIICTFDIFSVSSTALQTLREQGRSTSHIIGFFVGFCTSRILMSAILGWIGVLMTKWLQRKKSTPAQISTPNA